MTTDEPRSRFITPTGRRLIRSYGLLILLAIGFLFLAMCVREQPETVPAQSVGTHPRGLVQR